MKQKIVLRRISAIARLLIVFFAMGCIVNADDLHVAGEVAIQAPVGDSSPLTAGLATLLAHHEKEMRPKKYLLLRLSESLNEEYRRTACSELDFREEQFENDLRLLMERHFSAMEKQQKEWRAALNLTHEELAELPPEAVLLQSALREYAKQNNGDFLAAVRQILLDSFLLPQVREMPFSVTAAKTLLKLRQPFLVVKDGKIDLCLAMREQNDRTEWLGCAMEAGMPMVNFTPAAKDLLNGLVPLDTSASVLIYLPALTFNRCRLRDFVIAEAGKMDIGILSREVLP